VGSSLGQREFGMGVPAGRHFDESAQNNSESRSPADMKVIAGVDAADAALWIVVVVVVVGMVSSCPCCWLKKNETCYGNHYCEFDCEGSPTSTKVAAIDSTNTNSVVVVVFESLTSLHCHDDDHVADIVAIARVLLGEADFHTIDFAHMIHWYIAAVVAVPGTERTSEEKPTS
jgi:hypothetical protein